MKTVYIPIPEVADCTNYFCFYLLLVDPNDVFGEKHKNSKRYI